MADKAGMKESLRAFGFEDAVIDQALTRCSSIESAAEFIISGGVEAMKIRHEEEKHEVRVTRFHHPPLPRPGVRFVHNAPAIVRGRNRASSPYPPPYR